MLWEIATCSLPYKGANQAIIKMCVMEGQREEIPEECPPGYAQLIEKCWHQDPAQRPPITEVLEIIKSIKQQIFVVSTSYLISQ